MSQMLKFDHPDAPSATPRYAREDLVIGVAVAAAVGRDQVVEAAHAGEQATVEVLAAAMVRQLAQVARAAMGTDRGRG